MVVWCEECLTVDVEDGCMDIGLRGMLGGGC